MSDPFKDKTIAEIFEAMGFGKPGNDIDQKVRAALVELDSARSMRDLYQAELRSVQAQAIRLTGERDEARKAEKESEERLAQAYKERDEAETRSDLDQHARGVAEFERNKAITQRDEARAELARLKPQAPLVPGHDPECGCRYCRTRKAKPCCANPTPGHEHPKACLACNEVVPDLGKHVAEKHSSPVEAVRPIGVDANGTEVAEKSLLQTITDEQLAKVKPITEVELDEALEAGRKEAEAFRGPGGGWRR